MVGKDRTCDPSRGSGETVRKPIRRTSHSPHPPRPGNLAGLLSFRQIRRSDGKRGQFGSSVATRMFGSFLFGGDERYYAHLQKIAAHRINKSDLRHQIIQHHQDRLHFRLVADFGIVASHYSPHLCRPHSKQLQVRISTDRPARDPSYSCAWLRLF